MHADSRGTGMMDLQEALIPFGIFLPTGPISSCVRKESMSKATWIKWAIQFLTIQLESLPLGGGIGSLCCPAYQWFPGAS